MEAVEAGLPEGGEDQTEIEVVASLEAEEGEAAAVASEANKPLHEKVLYIFFVLKKKKKPCKTLGHCAVNKYIYKNIETVPNFVVLCVTSFHNRLFAYFKNCKFATLSGIRIYCTSSSQDIFTYVHRVTVLCALFSFEKYQICESNTC